MKLTKKFTTVTSFSKLLAVILFISFPFIGFYFGYTFNTKNATTKTGSYQQSNLVEATNQFITIDSDHLNKLPLDKSIVDFPLYPGTRFLKTEQTASCNGAKGYVECGSVAYRFIVDAETENVQKWYIKDNLAKYNYKMTGGAGSIGSYTQSSIEAKNGVKFLLTIGSNSSAEDPVQPIKTTISSLVSKMN